MAASAIPVRRCGTMRMVEACAPGTKVPETPSRTPPARHAPRVAAENAARADTPLPGVRCRIAARGWIAQGYGSVTVLDAAGLGRALERGDVLERSVYSPPPRVLT